MSNHSPPNAYFPPAFRPSTSMSGPRSHAGASNMGNTSDSYYLAKSMAASVSPYSDPASLPRPFSPSSNSSPLTGHQAPINSSTTTTSGGPHTMHGVFGMDSSNFSNGASASSPHSPTNTQNAFHANSNTNSSSLGKTRIAGLKEKLVEIDADLKTQKLARQSKEARVSSLSETLATLTTRLASVERRAISAEDTLRKVTAQLQAERIARDSLEKMMHHMVDEKMQILAKQLTDSVRSSTSEVGSMAQRLMGLEEMCSTLRHSLEREAKARCDLESLTVAKHSDVIATLVRDVSRDKQSRIDELESMRRQLTTQMASLTTSVEQDRVRRDRLNESVQEGVSRLAEDQRVALEAMKRDTERWTVKLVGGVQEQVRQLTVSVEGQTRAAGDGAKETAAKISEAVSHVRSSLREEQSVVEGRLAEALRLLEDRVWRVSQGLQSETEARELDTRRVVALLDEERRLRVEESEDMAKLLERSLGKIRESFDRD